MFIVWFFFLLKIYYILIFFLFAESVPTLPESFPSFSRVYESHASWVFAESELCNFGIDYEETFAPVARYSSIRTIISLAIEKG